ncbi:hypothetical protein C0992_004960 [Termitomyces sp. T32_za158]|nr:hypothetical protein C0992_004960 [Termitomyces sp. T32_za158]
MLTALLSKKSLEIPLAAFKDEEAKQIEKEHIEAKKEAQKVAHANACTSRIAQESTLKTFDLPISSYKKKEEYKILAMALELGMDGTVQQLTQQIKEHLANHCEESQKTPCFAGLFISRRCQKDKAAESGPSSHDPSTSQATVERI